MKYTYQTTEETKVLRVQDHVIKPSDVYNNPIAKAEIQRILSQGWRIVDFRPVKDGDSVIMRSELCDVCLTEKAANFYGKTDVMKPQENPRFIVERVALSVTDWWE